MTNTKARLVLNRMTIKKLSDRDLTGIVGGATGQSICQDQIGNQCIVVRTQNAACQQYNGG